MIAWAFTAFVAIALHAAAILGIGFTWKIQQASSPTIEVTLSQYSDEVAPKTPTLLQRPIRSAAATPTRYWKKLLVPRPISWPMLNRMSYLNPCSYCPDEAETDLDAELTTNTTSDFAVNAEQQDPADAVDGFNSKTMEELAREIASLEARLADEAQQQAKGPRVRRLTSVSARRTSDAYYLQAWRRRVEAVGNLNYPEEARQKQLYGDLKLLVTIRPDGSLQNVRVIASSGHKVLDDAALRIVRMAAPYPPFPTEMRKSTDLLEIVRSWQFRPRSGA